MPSMWTCRKIDVVSLPHFVQGCEIKSLLAALRLQGTVDNPHRLASGKQQLAELQKPNYGRLDHVLRSRPGMDDLRAHWAS